MNVRNVVGMKTEDYIKQNNFTGETKMKKLTLDKKTEPPKVLNEKLEAKTITRKINGKIKKLTPTENFIESANKRLQYLDYQFELLGKMVGGQYEKTEEMIDVIEAEILDMASMALDKLRKNKKPVASKKDFAAKLRKA
jgi:hypothetical protein